MTRWVLFLLTLCVSAVSAQDDAAKKEIDRFRGTWKFVSLEIEGVKVEPEQFKGASLMIDGEKFTMSDGVAKYKGSFKFDLSKTPKQLDVLFEEGPEKGKTALGIYELEGDTYKVCLGLTGKDRPKEFVSKPGSGHVLEVLQREKK
jgi:uncharacterized protein (TIGR03067 family)